MQKITPFRWFNSNAEETDKFFTGLSEGGKIDSPMKDEFWDVYFGMLTDKVGVQWMISSTYPQQNN